MHTQRPHKEPPYMHISKLLYEKIQFSESKLCVFLNLSNAFLFMYLEFSRKCLCFAPEIPEQSYPILRSRGKAYQTLNEGGKGEGGRGRGGEVTCTEYVSCQQLLRDALI